MPLHSLEEVPYVPRDYLIVEHGEMDLVLKAGNYSEIEDWLAGQLVHTKWITVMDHIAGCYEEGQYARFDIKSGNQHKTTLVVRTYVDHSLAPFSSKQEDQ